MLRCQLGQYVAAGRKQCRTLMKSYYHVCSLGLEKNILFSDDQDFVTGVNDIAISLLKFDIKLICYCLMSNHFHFILHGEKHVCCDFANEYKRRCGIRLRINKMEVNALHNLIITVNEINNSDYLENAIAYVLRNPLAAKINIMPYHYRWSSADIYFRGPSQSKGDLVNDLPERKRYRILKTRIDLPSHYMVDDKGMILPECFVDKELTERIFRHPSRLMLLLAKRIESDIEQKFGIAERISFSDSELKTLVNELIHNEFGVSGLSSLTARQKIELCNMMRKNFNASIKQISRIVRIDSEIVASVV